jgi:hypothetical protein
MTCEFCQSKKNAVLYGYCFDANHLWHIKICGNCCDYLEGHGIPFPLHSMIERNDKINKKEMK